MFPGEILDKKARKQDGPHKHIKWRQAARAFNTDDRQQRAAEIERTKQEQLLQEARSLDQINEITERSVEESPMRPQDLQGAFPDSRETLNSGEPLIED